MSRIGKKPVVFWEKVDVTIENNNVSIKGPLWNLSFNYSPLVEVIKEWNSLIVNPLNESANALWGTTRAVLNNMVEWVSEWYTRSLEIIWVWYKFEVQWNTVILSIWYSHKVNVVLPDGLSAAMDEKLKNVIHFKWIDKQLIGEFAAKIRSMKKPEPYKWKWIRYQWEQVKTKAWKTGSKK